jgi:hypothetical protein
MGESRYSVSFRIWHPSIDPSDITAAIGLEPLRAWKAGEPRTTPTGRLLEGINRETYWSVKVCKGKMPPHTLATEVDSTLDNLSAHRAFLHRIRMAGGRCEFFVGWFIQSQAGETFSHSTLAKMAALGIDLSLDNYNDATVLDEQ